MSNQIPVDNKAEKSEPTILVIFGATGNLAHRKLIPALFRLEIAKLLPERFLIIGAARRNLSVRQYQDQLSTSLKNYSKEPFSEEIWRTFSRKISYFPIEFNQEADFARLAGHLGQLEKEWGSCFNRIFYLSTAPSFFPVIFAAMKKSKLNLGCSRHGNPSRIVIEKPFGQNLQSARSLNRKLDKVFSEDQIYRIDHYLAKETVQNILAFRFANEIFEPILNNNFVDHVEIVQAESTGVEDRGEYYEEAGAMRDIVQNHLLQVLAITTMDEPGRYDAPSIREQKVKLLKNVVEIKPPQVEKAVVRGQYGAGEVNGQRAINYRQEPEVSPKSDVETFMAMKLFINNKCWRGVPIYIKTGKRLVKDLATITVQFKEVGHALFSNLPAEDTAKPNLLTFQLQPDEGIAIRLLAKRPGLKFDVTPVDMEFCYASTFRERQPDAYERLLLDVILGDQTLFPHIDEVIRSWEIVDAILKGWEELPPPKFPNYSAGSWGPEEANRFIEKDGRDWLAHELKICQLHPH